MEVCNSFEMSHKEVDGKIKIDMDYFNVKMEQCASHSLVLAPCLPILASFHSGSAHLTKCC